ncbi:hemerythrin HHE cation binding domain-containing protein [Kribbella steppae]|uniref:Hemerythrin HHE cation binding domain-containing protein n=1 Tax=Kribbella steppae TaxID=2512223 RepID=A0A4R2H7X7_9ACTN|nr:hemerythrin domain-containing protein [Kribbella steppae]TCO20515.1 hemerythrin HHE cation binding domain-containing protein [Kribbella steppae]
MPKILPATGGDVVEIILADHRWFEEALRELRDVQSDRSAVLADLATVLIAHAEAEESKVYPQLRKKDAIDADEVEHSEHEHDEGNAALLELMEVEDTGSEDFSEKLHELSEALSHHLDEEERDVLNPARTDVSEEVRRQLGDAFAEERARLIDSGCGDIANVRKLVEAS